MLISRRHIPVGGAAIIQIQLVNKRGMPVEPFHVNRSTGRIVLRSEGFTIGAGSLPSFYLSADLEQGL
jgi:translation elongation factor EF-1alpha